MNDVQPAPGYDRTKPPTRIVVQMDGALSIEHFDKLLQFVDDALGGAVLSAHTEGVWTFHSKQ
jgi:hypothetical protein